MPAASSSRVDTKRADKENAPPRGRSSRDESEGSDMSGDEDAPRRSTKVSSKTSSSKPLKSKRDDDDGESSSVSRIKAQRDTFQKQFEELSKLRNTEMENLYNRYKQKAELQANAQSEIINNLTSLNEKLQTKVSSLEKALSAAKALPSAGGPFEETKKADPKEVNVLKEDIRKLEKDLAKRSERVTQLEKELKAEVEHSQALQSKEKVNPLAASISTNPEEAEKDAMSLALYEEITGLGLVNVRIKPVKHGKETVFSCIQTFDGRSVSYKLRSYLQVNPDANERKSKAWIKMLHYAPESLDKEIDRDLLNRLGIFRSELTMPFEQVGGLFESLKSRLSRTGEYERLEGE